MKCKMTRRQFHFYWRTKSLIYERILDPLKYWSFPESKKGKIAVIFWGTNEISDDDLLTNINFPKVRFGLDNALPMLLQMMYVVSVRLMR